MKNAKTKFWRQYRDRLSVNIVELTFRPYTNSISFFFNYQRRWDLVLILESLYNNTYMMRYIAQALFRGVFFAVVSLNLCNVLIFNRSSETTVSGQLYTL